MEGLREEEEFQKYNTFIEQMWPKYQYVGVQLLAKKFKRKDMPKLDQFDEYFDQLPETAMSNANEFERFSNFAMSDLLVEIIRAVKLKVVLDHLQHYQQL